MFKTLQCSIVSREMNVADFRMGVTDESEVMLIGVPMAAAATAPRLPRLLFLLLALLSRRIGLSLLLGEEAPPQLASIL